MDALLTGPLSLASPALFATALALALVAIGVAIVRAITLPRAAMMSFAGGVLCLCLGAGGLMWARPQIGHVAVVVDVSPSTLTATYHDPRALGERLEQLLGGTPYRLYQLADGVTRAPSQSLRELPVEVDCRQTTYAPPPAADAVVLFSDAQFTSPSASESGSSKDTVAAGAAAAPPTFIVRDPALDQPEDAAVERLELRGDDTVVATVNNTTAGPRRLTLSGTDLKDATIDAGRFVLTARVAPDAREVIGFVHPRDRWVANDALALRLPPPSTSQKWWVGANSPPSPPPTPSSSQQWVHVPPDALPTNLADYLAAGVIVLDNVAADAMENEPRRRLHQYVRDLGGGLVILGGDRAFAAGGYAGSTLEELSPLASTPPEPATQWLLLIDSSGSMARTLGDNSRWHFAIDAVGKIIPLLPADDTVSIGSFAEALRWWTGGRSVRELQGGLSPPRDMRPGGPTNLAAALWLIAETADGALPTQLLIITDAEVNFRDADALAVALADKRIALSVLASDAVAANNPLLQLAQRTGGRITGQSDPRRWSAELKQLMRAAAPPWLGEEPIRIRFTPAGPDFPPQRVDVWNRTWLKPEATELAIGERAAERVPAVAAWNLGSGAVISAAFAPSAKIVAALAERVAVLPRDPRFRIAHEPGQTLRVTLDAQDDAGYMNGLDPRIELSRDGTRGGDAVRMTQVAPGRYEVRMPAPQRPAFVTVSLNGRVLERFAIAGRYPPEYERLGNDRPAMEHLARATGGAVIEPSQTSPIEFAWPTRRLALAPYLAAAGALLVGATLVQWRLR